MAMETVIWDVDVDDEVDDVRCPQSEQGLLSPVPEVSRAGLRSPDRRPGDIRVSADVGSTADGEKERETLPSLWHMPQFGQVNTSVGCPEPTDHGQDSLD